MSAVVGAYAMTADDFNLDGKLDIVATRLNSTSCSSHRSTTSAGAGVASFATHTIIGAGAEPRACASADLNGDGLPDLVIVNTIAHSLTLLQNVGSPASTSILFSDSTTPVSDSPQGVAFADFNADGLPDMVVTRTAVDKVSVLINSSIPGGGLLFSGDIERTTGDRPVGVSVGDFNGDGKPDFVTADMAAAGVLGTVTVFINKTAPAAASADFYSGITFPVGYGPFDVAVGDINLDGRPDLAVTNYDSNTFSILLNDTIPGPGSPVFANAVSYATGAGPWGVQVGDLNGDGKPEVVVVNSLSNSLSVFVNSVAPGATSPAFSTVTSFATESVPVSLVARDFNGDGKIDLATACYGANTLDVYLNTSSVGSATVDFATASDQIHSDPQSVAIREINGNGKPDLAVITAATYNKAEFRLNLTEAGLTVPSFGSSAGFDAGSTPQAMGFLDFNGDGKPDLATAAASDDEITILTNDTLYPPLTGGQPSPDFNAATPLETADDPRGLVVADFNGDGKTDIAVACYGSNQVQVFLRTPTSWPASGFEAPQAVSLPTGAGPVSLAAADLNRDGRMDLAVANRLLGTVSILRNTTGTGSLTIAFNVEDTIALVDAATALPVSIAAGDFNGDGYPDLAVSSEAKDKVTLLINGTPEALSLITPPFPLPLLIAFDDATAGVAFTTGDAPKGLIVEDLNRDGRPDVAVANSGDGSVSVLLNVMAAGTFTPALTTKVDFATGTGARVVSGGDINRDGKRDLAVCNETAGTVSILLAE